MLETALLVVALSALGALIAGVVLLFVFYFVGKRSFRTIVQRLFGLVIERLLSDKYHENLMELWSAVRRTSIQNILEISLRAEDGKLIQRPLGSARTLPHYDTLMFVPGQMARLPKEGTIPVDMKVTLGPKAEKPLQIQIPLMIAGMGYGEGLSEEAKVALAKAAKQIGTATNSGEGPFLKEEREAAGKFIWQISRTSWGRNPQAIAAADMIEVQMGQGARMGPFTIEPFTVKGKAQKLMGISPVQSVVTPAVMPGINTPWDWPKYVTDLRAEAAGKPIAIKIMATGALERDLAVCLEADFDVIVLDGSQGGSSGASPLICDDLGIPSLLALVRAERFLCDQGARKDVSLVVAGGYATPGECLKAIALGADAIYLGTVPLFALIHKQVHKILPWEPLTQLVWYNSPYKQRLDIDLASKSVANVLKSMTMEMEEGVRALGKTVLSEVGPNDLVALDEWTAQVTGVKRAYPWQS
ncbi:FMN-binding glutamate synthase family protein [Desulfosporosinus fructosivorans]|uniref:FMN-binding glutamate synthase family protein n=1 Tax=Desulfosporosinus fructosivorans TaxID=2018669 RepID=A0A4Z0RF43_9FIRM|nr:FMN-binding glutamate synthase family protein [Desulfosporosinus fructosivorans]TGE40206.1 FMN-binding glutamate synthase family protein [Desulfosporosinus fructosivorans]